MQYLRNSIGAAIIATLVLALVGLVFGGSVASAMADKDNAAKVAYAPVASGTYNFDPAHGVIGFSDSVRDSASPSVRRWPWRRSDSRYSGSFHDPSST